MSDATGMDLRRETISGFAAKSSNGLVAFVGSIIFARLLAPEVFGAVYLILAAAQVLNKTVTGWAAAAKYHVSSTRHTAETGLGGMLIFILGWLALLTLGLILFQYQLVLYFSLDGAAAFLLAITASIAVFESVERLTQAVGDIGFSHWLTAGRSVVMVVLQAALIWIGYGASGFVFGWTAASLIAAGVGLLVLRLRPHLPTRKQYIEMWQYAKSSIPGDFFGSAYYQLDMLLVGYIVGSLAAGHYRVGLALTMPATYLSGVISTGLMTAVAAGTETADRDPLTDIRNSLRYSSLFAVPILVGGALIARDLIAATYGTEYTAAAPLLITLAVYRVLQTQTGPVLSALRGYGHPDWTAKLTGTTVVFNVVLGYWLATLYGAFGIALATILAEGLRFVVSRWLVSRATDTFVSVPWLFIEQCGAALLMGIAIVGLQQIYNIQSLVDVAVVVSVGAVIYFAALLVSRPHQEVLLSIIDKI